MTVATFLPTGVRPVLAAADAPVQQAARIGHMVAFFFRTMAGVPLMLRRYPREFFRLLSDVMAIPPESEPIRQGIPWS